MVDLLVLSEDDVRRCLDHDVLADALRAAFRSISDQTASVPERVAAWSGTGMLGAMPGLVPDLGGDRGPGLGAKLVAYFPDNDATRAPAHQAVVALFDTGDGTPLALMGGTYLTAVRTATAAAVAAATLAAPAPPGGAGRTLAVLGAGVQGQAHLEAFGRLLPLGEVRVASRDQGAAAALAARSEVAVVSPSFEAAVHGADLVCLCTDAPEPVLAQDWLAEGAHVSSVGSGAEVDPDTVEAASVFVESRAAATRPFPAGSRELAGRDPASVVEVGEVLLGRHPGRTAPDQLTLYKSMGHAAEDVAAAVVVHLAALAAGVGTRVTL